MKFDNIASMVAILLAVILAVLFIWHWQICYRWCPLGYSLILNRKTGENAASDRYAQPGEKGVLEQMLGPGRYLDLNPYIYTATQVKDIEVPAGYIRLVKNNIGEELPPGKFLAEPHQKGTQKMVLTPGRWRINTYGQEVSQACKATIIKPGYVGVQSLLESRTIRRNGREIFQPKGVLDEILQAGYYNINPKQIRVDEIEVGYRTWDLMIEYETVYQNGKQVKRIKPGSGLCFPLADGKQMQLDFTVVWGIFPQEAPRIIREYGTIEMVEHKIIEPQVLSICKIAGSNFTTQQFIEGVTRAKFQQTVTAKLQEMGKRKGIHFLIALVRGFHPAEDIKQTIQARMLAEEEKETLRIEQARDTEAAKLEQAKRQVAVAIKDYDAETEALVQEELEKGKKKAAEIRAQADRTVARLDRERAEIEARIVKIKGQAEADVIEVQKKAEATRLSMLIQAYGGAIAYNLATFAESLPATLRIEYRYSGPGTLWTDIKGMGLSLLQKLSQKPR